MKEFIHKVDTKVPVTRTESFQVLEFISAGLDLSARPADEPSKMRSLLGKIRNEPDDVLTGHKGPIVSLALDGDVMYSGGADGLIGVWDMDAFSEKFREFFKGHNGPVMGIAVMGDYLLSIGDNLVKFFDKASFELIEEKTLLHAPQY